MCNSVTGVPDEAYLIQLTAQGRAIDNFALPFRIKQRLSEKAKLFFSLSLHLLLFIIDYFFMFVNSFFKIYLLL